MPIGRTAYTQDLLRDRLVQQADSIERGGSNLWYISFAGGAGGINNIRVYHDSGRTHAKPDLLPTGKGDPPLHELRGFAIAGGLLYVVNAHESLSQILVYALDAHGGYRFAGIFASVAEVPALVHPYDLAFDEQGNCYVSSQDTNVVTGLRAAGGALEVAAHLQQLYPPPGRFLAGTRVASSLGTLPGLQPPAARCRGAARAGSRLRGRYPDQGRPLGARRGVP